MNVIYKISLVLPTPFESHFSVTETEMAFRWTYSRRSLTTDLLNLKPEAQGPTPGVGPRGWCLQASDQPCNPGGLRSKYQRDSKLWAYHLQDEWWESRAVAVGGKHMKDSLMWTGPLQRKLALGMRTVKSLAREEHESAC